jgi:hypothetical protein
VQVTVPIHNRIAEADLARDELQLKQSEVRLRQLQNQARLEVEDAVIAMRRARASYDAAVQARKYQQESLEAEQMKYEVGASTAFFVIQYESLLAQAKSTEVAAKSAYVKARAALERATGNILTARVPPGTTYEQFQIMLQNLLADRFQLAVHHETRQHLSYKLVVAKNGPKFKEAGAPAEQDDDAPPRPSGSKPFKFDADGYPVFGPGDSGTKNVGQPGQNVRAADDDGPLGRLPRRQSTCHHNRRYRPRGPIRDQSCLGGWLQDRRAAFIRRRSILGRNRFRPHPDATRSCRTSPPPL